MLLLKPQSKAIPSSVVFMFASGKSLFNRFNTVFIKSLKHLETLIYGFRNDGNVCIQLSTSAKVNSELMNRECSWIMFGL
jgi:hypothetical protein